MRSDRGGSDVHRHAESLVVKPGPQRDDLRLAVHGDRDFPFALAQECLQPAEEGRIAGKVHESPFALERLVQAPQVAGGILHVRFFHLDVVQANDRVQLDLARIRVLAHDLAVNLAAGRHVDDDVALDARLAGQAMPLCEPAAFRIARLDFGDGRDARAS